VRVNVLGLQNLGFAGYTAQQLAALDVRRMTSVSNEVGWFEGRGG
jgi:hypothetical protein